MIRIPLAKPLLGPMELQLVTQAIETGEISSQGSYVKEFEEAFAKLVGAHYAVAVCNGTCALVLAMMALGVAPGDEVIVPDLTFAATANSVMLLGGIPVLVAPEPRHWQIDTDLLREASTERTRGITVVHLYGHPCDITTVLEKAIRKGWFVVEDAAEALGAAVSGKAVGTFGQIGCFSFFANKIITTGEGGMCVTNDVTLYEKLRCLRDHGMSPSRRYWHVTRGGNFRMTNLQAAVGLAQLHRFEEFLAERRRIVERYIELLRSSRIGDRIRFQEQAPWAVSAPWLFTIILPSEVERGRVIERMADRGIETRPMFYPLHTQPAFRSLRYVGSHQEGYPNWAMQGLSLPTFVGMTDEHISMVCDSLVEAVV